MATGDLVNCIGSQGSDSRRLGTWSCLVVHDHEREKRTHHNAEGTCTGSACIQHLKYMAGNRGEDLPEDMTCPRQLVF